MPAKRVTTGRPRKASRSASRNAPAKKVAKKAVRKAVKKAAKRAAKKTAKTAKPRTTARRAPTAPPSKTRRSTPAKVSFPTGLQKAEGDLPVQAYITSLPAWQREAAHKFDVLVSREVPHVRKALKWSAAFYGQEGQGWFASVKAFSKVLKLNFFAGASLKPAPPSGDKANRSFDVKEGTSLDEDQLADWIRQAAKLPGWGTVE